MIQNTGIRSSGGSQNSTNVQLPLPTIDGHCHMFGQSLSVGKDFHPWSKAGQVVFVPKGGTGSAAYPADVLVYVTKQMMDPYGVAYDYQEPHVLTSRAVIEVGTDAWPLRATTPIGSDGKKFTHIFDGGYRFRVISHGLGLSASFTLRQVGRFSKFVGYFLGNDGANAGVCVSGITSPSGARAAVPLLLDLGYTPLEVDLDGISLSAIGAWAINLPPAAGDKDGYYDDGGGSKSWVWFDRKNFQYTIEALADVSAQYPGNVWPMLPYDPRRAADSKDDHGADPLFYTRDAVDNFGYVGVKLYSRCGWMPTNNRVIHGTTNGPKLDDAMEKLYAHAEANELPLLNHTSPTGFPPNIGAYTRSALVLPKKYEHGGWAADELAPPPWPQSARDDARRDDGTAEAKFQRLCRVWARAGCDRAARYVHYDQFTVSPYSWEPVLQRHPNLRLNLAHFGSQLSWLSGLPSLQTAAMKAAIAGPWHELAENPMVAGADLFEGLFGECCKISAADMVDRLVNSSVNPAHHFIGWAERELFGGLWFSPDVSILGGSGGISIQVLPRVAVGTPDYCLKTNADVLARVDELVPTILAEPGWRKWVADWKARFPLGWFKKIRELMSKYPNVYADIAYFSGEDSPHFVTILTEFIAEVRADALLQDRTIMGTDWFMTEMDGMSPSEFWDRFCKVVPAGKDPLWERLTTRNCLNYLHLKLRLDKMEAWYKKRKGAAYKQKMWWPQLRKFYGLDPGTSPAPPDSDAM